MNDTDYIIELNKTIGLLTAKIEGFCEMITQHEVRLINIEKKQTECTIKQQCQGQCPSSTTSNDENSIKNQLLMLLAKGLIIAILTTASLTGTGSLIMKVIGGG